MICGCFPANATGIEDLDMGGGEFNLINHVTESGEKTGISTSQKTQTYSQFDS